MGDGEAALLAAIRDAADGDDDGPRRVYADWLIERGDPRGKHMRLALAPDAPDPVTQEQAWEAALLPAALDACARWEARFGPGFALSPDDFERGLPSRVQFDGSLRDLPARAAALVPMTAQDLEIDTDDHWVLARRDWSVLAIVSWSDWHGARAPEETARVRVHAFPSLDVIAERAHRYRALPPRSGQPVELRFARHADVLLYRVNAQAETLRYERV
jgi:uncharacterized protein (TIGR02996 family)